MKIVAQVIGALAVFFFISSVQLKDKKNMMLSQFIANSLYSIQYFLLGATGAGFMNLTSVSRCLIQYEYDRDKKKMPFYILLIFIVLIVAISAFYVKKPIDLIPAIITIAYAISTWRDNRYFIILTFIIAPCLWVFYNIKIGAYSALVGNAFEFSSGIVALCRLINNKK